MLNVNSCKFKLMNKKDREDLIAVQDTLITKLVELNVKVNKPREMEVGQLKELVNRHRKTIETKKDFITKQHLEVAKSNGLTKEEVVDRVDDLNWDVDHAVSVKSKKEERRIKSQKRMMLLQDIRENEIKEDFKKVAELGKVLASL